jgi:NAD(P)-dependent dehydrogenase (short-subunit alcohol dehydrogenase family)
MSKAGVAVMTRSLAVEWARHGIRLNALKEGDDDRYKARNPLGGAAGRTSAPTWRRS